MNSATKFLGVLLKMWEFVLWILLFSMTIDASWMTTRECDEELTGPIGVLQFQDPYKDLKSWTFSCEYNITVKESKNILVKISSSMNSPINACGNSYIMLKDGFDQSSPLLGSGKYCGSNDALPLITPGNQLNIRTSIELGLDAHYTLKYQENTLTCGGIIELTPDTVTKTIEYPNFSNSSSSSDCAWIFIAPANYALSMNFTLFNSSLTTNCEDEYVELRNGGTSVSPLISQACSNSEEKIMTTDNLLYIKYHSTYEEPSIFFRTDIIAVENRCEEILAADSGTIVSPNYPFDSPNKICTWKITAPSRKRIVINFNDLHLSDSLNCELGSNLRISETSPENGTENILGTFCGFNKHNSIKTSCNKATIKFRSDYHNIGHFRGFVLNFATIDEPCVINCEGILTSDNGVISWPNFPEDCPFNPHREWKIQLLSGKRIKFQFFRIMIESSAACSEGHLSIKEIINGTEKDLGIFCNYSNPMPITTSSSMAKVIFRSNNNDRNSGFLLTYSAVEDRSFDSGSCNEEFREPTGIIISPGYPHKCPTPIECVYKIIQPPGTIIMLDVTNLHFSHTTANYIAIWDPENESPIVSNTWYHSHNRFPYSLNSSTNVLNITFHTGNDAQDCKGFNAVYTTFDKKCGGLLTEPKGTIKSPNYPANYGNLEKCLWVIRAPPGQGIILTWSSFETENKNQDGVEIRGKNLNGVYTELGTYSGSILPPPTVTYGNRLVLKFWSDPFITFQGFSAKYVFIEAPMFDELNSELPNN